MDMDRLEEFVLIARNHSFKKTAEQLGISPAALSARMNAFEKNLGVRLLNRSAHKVELTDEGRRFLPDAKELVGERDNALLRIRSVEYNTYRSLKLAISGFSMIPMLGPFLDIVNLKHPDIHLELHDDTRYSIAHSISSGDIDLFFTYCDERDMYNGIERELIYTTRLCILMPKYHPLASRSSVTMKDLDGERFILYPRTAEPTMRNSEMKILENSGINFSLHEDEVSPSFFRSLVPIGKGICFFPWVMRDFMPLNTAAVALDSPDAMMSMFMFYRKDNPNTVVASFVRDFREFRVPEKKL